MFTPAAVHGIYSLTRENVVAFYGPEPPVFKREVNQSQRNFVDLSVKKPRVLSTRVLISVLNKIK